MAAPLTAADKKALETALAEIKSAKEIAARAQRAGLDVKDELAQLDAVEAQARGLLGAFFPTGSE